MTFIGSDSFDSRGLRYTDCYAQRFLKPGSYGYHVLATGSEPLNDDRPYMVTVGERASATTDMNQHTVQLTWDGAHFEPDARETVIKTGDLVLWNCPQRLAPPYVVVGEKSFFASSSLGNECGYSHAFGLPGTYEWMDARGSGVGGTVVVSDPRMGSEHDMVTWKKALAKGTLVMIGGGKAEPAKVEIVTGQTVFFTVVSGPVTVTDRRLLHAGPADSTPAGPGPTKPGRRRPKANPPRGRKKQGA